MISFFSAVGRLWSLVIHVIFSLISKVWQITLSLGYQFYVWFGSMAVWYQVNKIPSLFLCHCFLNLIGSELFTETVYSPSILQLTCSSSMKSTSGSCFIKVVMLANLCWNDNYHGNSGNSASWLDITLKVAIPVEVCHHNTLYEMGPWNMFCIISQWRHFIPHTCHPGINALVKWTSLVYKVKHHDNSAIHEQGHTTCPVE